MSSDLEQTSDPEKSMVVNERSSDERNGLGGAEKVGGTQSDEHEMRMLGRKQQLNVSILVARGTQQSR